MKSPLILRIFKEGQLLEVKQFDLEQIVIGRNAEVQLDLNHDSVASIHSLIELRDNGYYICDLGSQSGTFLNGKSILDEAIASGDEIQIGPFKIVFFVGIPKPKAVVPDSIISIAQPPKSESLGVSPVVNAPEKLREEPAVVPVEQIVTPKISPKVPLSQPEKVSPVMEASGAEIIPVEKPVIRKSARVNVPLKKVKTGKTFAPVSEVQDLRSFVKPSKGNVVEVMVCWKERIIETYHFKNKGVVKLGTDINVPDSSIRFGHKFITISQSVNILLTPDMGAEVITSVGTYKLEELLKTGKAQLQSGNAQIRLDQSEVVFINLPNSGLKLIVRFIPAPPVLPLVPPLFFSSSEITGLIMALIIVGLLGVYIEANNSRIQEDAKLEDLTRTASIIFNTTPTPIPTPALPEATPTPPPVAATPVPTPDKIKVADEKKEAVKKGPPAEVKNMGQAQVAKKAAEVAPIPNSQNKPKKFTSSIKQGGAIKLGEKAGANAQSANKDVSKMGLFSAFGGGGIRGKLDQAYSGAGDLLGEADKATGASGMAANRAGDDLGSKFKDNGAGGKGISTQGIAGIGTKGRSNGQSAYGSENGFGSKTSVAIEAGGAEEDFAGTIDKEAVRRVVKAGYKEIKGCYERELNRLGKTEKLEGKVVIGWDIIAKGKAQNVRVKTSSLGNKNVENCLRERIAGWIFPEPPAGLTAEVAFPFVFRAQEN